MKFIDSPIKAWDDEYVEFFVHCADDGTIWFHHNLKKKLTKDAALSVAFSLSEFFCSVAETFKVDKMFSWCPDKKIEKWALWCGCKSAGVISIDGTDHPIVEFSKCR